MLEQLQYHPWVSQVEFRHADFGGGQDAYIGAVQFNEVGRQEAEGSGDVLTLRQLRQEMLETVDLPNARIMLYRADGVDHQLLRPGSHSEDVWQPEILDKQATDKGWCIEARVPANLVYLRGHFDDTPVVAGVVQLKWVGEWLVQQSGRDLNITRLEAIKFHRLLLPEETFSAELKHNAANASWSFVIRSNQEKVASGRFREAR